MAETAVNPPAARAAPADEAGVPDNQYVLEALDAHKKQGLELAVRARWITMGITSVFLIAINPEFEVIYYLGIMALLCINGWFIRRVGRVGQSRLELLLIFFDLLLMTVGMVAPNPLSQENLPLAMQYRYDNFIYFYVILAAGTLAYSWRTVIAIGVWTVAMWLAAFGLAWWFSEPVAGMSENAYYALGEYPGLFPFMDPNDFVLKLRIQEAIVFLLVALTLGVSARRFGNLVQSNASLERERANLSRYFSPNVVEQLSQNDEPLKQVHKADVAVLFVDIVGFTKLSEGRDPHDVIELLRGFHSRMEREVFRHHGTLDKYLGDGLMATFGTPVAGDRDAANALSCALAMQETLARWNRERGRRGEPKITAGIGLHYGETVLGDIGSNRLEYAVIGTAVNVAARLEQMTRRLDAGIVISGALRSEVLANRPDAALTAQFRENPDQEIRGLNAPMTVWSLPRDAGGAVAGG